MPDSPYVSFIVPAWQAETTLAETLDSLAAQETSTPFEIIVVDDGSSDATRDQAEQWRDAHTLPVTIISISHQGEAAAMNAGIQIARGERIAWVESDVRLDPRWLAILLEELNEEGVVGAGGWLLPAPEDGGLAQIFGCEIACKIYYQASNPIHLTSANVLYAKQVFDELGPCRTDLGVSSFDSEFNQRIVSRGYRLRCNLEAKAWHQFKPSLLDCLKRAWWYGAKRPEARRQVLYPFDRVTALSVLGAGLLFLALACVGSFPKTACALAVASLLSQVVYAGVIYWTISHPSLLAAPPIFGLRNVVFLAGYAWGWIKRIMNRSGNPA